MFFLNFGAQPPKTIFEELAVGDGVRLRGACLLASGYDHAKLTRNELPDAGSLLLDPQVYLSGLSLMGDDPRIWRLASHPWFMVDGVSEFDSEEHRGKREWEDEVKAVAAENWKSRAPTGDKIPQAAQHAVQTQHDLDCAYIILPAPLISEREQEAQAVAEWTNAGVKAARTLAVTKPLLATVALHEGVLNDAAFGPLAFLDAIVTQVAACRGISGVYIVIAQNGEPSHPFGSNTLTWRAYQSLCRRFRRARTIQTILVNFCDVAGLACLAHGANGFATGNFQSTRRLYIPWKSEGRAFPYFYSHRTCTELKPDSDLTQVTQAGLFASIEDTSPYSGALMRALQTSGSSANLAEWVSNPSNVKAAHQHLVYRLNELAISAAAMSVQDRLAAIRTWLDEGIAKQPFVLNVLAEEKGTRHALPLTELRNAFLTA